MWTAVLNCGDGRFRHFLFHVCLHSSALLKFSWRRMIIFSIHTKMLVQWIKDSQYKPLLEGTRIKQTWRLNVCLMAERLNRSEGENLKILSSMGGRKWLWQGQKSHMEVSKGAAWKSLQVLMLLEVKLLFSQHLLKKLISQDPTSCSSDRSV